jgi:small-conductance mechanosensitive channel
VGVGIGFGLQKLAANYVSGFVILAERSVRIGDNVRVDGFEGRITDITGRYTLIRSGVGRESIVPNEMLITQRVENLSLADPRVWMSTVVSVGYDSDVDLVIRLLGESALVNPRVLRDPGKFLTHSAWCKRPESPAGVRRPALRQALQPLPDLEAWQLSGLTRRPASDSMNRSCTGPTIVKRVVDYNVKTSA